jgi:transcriptional regulator with XRE-family HTH domain
MPEDTKSVTPTQCFARRVRALRRAKDLSQEELANRMTELGIPMGQNTVARIENAARALPLDEALAFAVVLRAPLFHLLSPAPNELLQLAPDLNGLDRDGAYRWMVGVDPGPGRGFVIEIDEESAELYAEAMEKLSDLSAEFQLQDRQQEVQPESVHANVHVPAPQVRMQHDRRKRMGQIEETIFRLGEQLDEARADLLALMQEEQER